MDLYIFHRMSLKISLSTSFIMHAIKQRVRWPPHNSEPINILYSNIIRLRQWFVRPGELLTQMKMSISANWFEIEEISTEYIN